MSLVALALRIVTVRALRDATLAMGRVYDSTIDPIDNKIVKGENPIIIVATDDDKREIEGRDLLGACRELDLVIELVVAAKVDVPTGPQGDPETEIVVLDTDEGFEVILNLMGRQVDRALLAGKTAGTPWSDLWRDIVIKITSYTSKRGAGVIEKGRRFTARQIIIQVDTIAEPSFGPIASGTIWHRILTAFRTDTALQKIADLIEAEITTPTLQDWRRAAVDLGLRDLGALRIGLGPAIENPPLNEQTPPLEEVTVIDPNGQTWVGNAQTIEDALGPEPDDA